MTAIQVRAALLLIALFLLGGCASSSGSPVVSTPPGTTTGTATTAASATITIKNFEYGAPITVAPGAVVAVANVDAAGHTVTADQGQAFDVDVRGSGGTGTFTAPAEPGSYAFHCKYHPNMHGTLTVK
jgi:plastocyanin